MSFKSNILYADRLEFMYLDDLKSFSIYQDKKQGKLRVQMRECEMGKWTGLQDFDSDQNAFTNY